jgi:hypothetical protein
MHDFFFYFPLHFILFVHGPSKQPHQVLLPLIGWTTGHLQTSAYFPRSSQENLNLPSDIEFKAAHSIRIFIESTHPWLQQIRNNFKQIPMQVSRFWCFMVESQLIYNMYIDGNKQLEC